MLFHFCPGNEKQKCSMQDSNSILLASSSSQCSVPLWLSFFHDHHWFHSHITLFSWNAREFTWCCSDKDAVLLMHMEGHGWRWKPTVSIAVQGSHFQALSFHDEPLGSIVVLRNQRRSSGIQHFPCQSIGVHLRPLDGLGWTLIDPNWLPCSIMDSYCQCWWSKDAASFRLSVFLSFRFIFKLQKSVSVSVQFSF